MFRMLFEALDGPVNVSDQSMASFMRNEEEALEAELRQRQSKSRITQGIAKSTVPLDEALEGTHESYITMLKGVPIG